MPEVTSTGMQPVFLARMRHDRDHAFYGRAYGFQWPFGQGGY